MKIIVSSSITREWNAPMDRLRVLNPPVALTLNAWQTASKSDIPASR